MSEFVRYEVRDRAAILTIDNPPVNALGAGVWEAIDRSIGRAAADDRVVAIVLTGAGRHFVAGADIKVFDTLRTPDASMARSARTHAVLRRIEDTEKPVVAALHGSAFGGGLEVAMGCHYRVAALHATLGQPEVLLGLLPGAGGTQRLPRLCGPTRAIEMCSTGRPIGAQEALRCGLVDAIASEALIDDAIRFGLARAAEGKPRKPREIPIAEADRTAGIEACVDAERRLRHDPVAGPWRAVHAIRAGLADGFDAGSVTEREMFAACVVSTESRALRHLFFAERAAAKPIGLAWPARVPEVRTALVIGAGTMGAGIAMALANAGVTVLLSDLDAAARNRAMETIARTYQSAVEKGRLSESEREQAERRILPIEDDTRFTEADIAVEAVFEDLALKRDVFRRLAEHTRPDCILASNTSTLDIDECGRAAGCPERVVGLHFFSPAHVMKLLEIVRGQETSDAVIASALTLAKRLRKVPIVVRNCFGFAANRLLAYYMREAYLLLEEGASVDRIDRAAVAFGMPMGPFAMQDVAGLDVGARIRHHLRARGRRRADGPESAVLDRLFDMGRYGQKTGAGWYRYEGGSRTGRPDPVVDEIAAEESRKRGVDRRSIADDEIVDRMITAVINEGARILDEGFVDGPGDLDVAFCYGFGFPRHRGGPLFYADTIGLPRVRAQLAEYRERFGDHWRPAARIERLATDGRGFHEAR
ncbi:MAG: 3-hydroxyacyl-CoA dehydrogenase NAD-binding domain-containing protein [Vicinamibacterales bacterium]